MRNMKYVVFTYYFSASIDIMHNKLQIDRSKLVGKYGT